MIREPEPELMEDEESVTAYSQANFDEPHERFLDLMEGTIGKPVQQESILDLGCGSGDIIRRWQKRYTGNWRITGLDASEVMLNMARHSSSSTNIQWIKSYLPELPEHIAGDRIICNSLLHHLKSPDQLWKILKAEKFLGSSFFLMDLSRPATEEMCQELVNLYAGDEPEIHKQDFYNSLKAAYRPEEVFQQLYEANLDKTFRVEVVSDRHFIVHGILL